MESKVANIFLRHKIEDSVYTQTSYTGQIRWCRKPLYDEPILQQQVTVSTFGNYVITKQEVKWVDVPQETL